MTTVTDAVTTTGAPTTPATTIRDATGGQCASMWTRRLVAGILFLFLDDPIKDGKKEGKKDKRNREKCRFFLFFFGR
ncbi:hypothetical protein [Pandoravirus japonicus]|uniref:Uncharacterized protein n=1 Tax=Pandoravirus japonicus TaxID=2823154 RepID=A0A811BNW7_9VIRU|nr:hypothetical protein [Pandoravirus japonicus]